MKAVIQRVRKCAVRINGAIESEIGPGILIFLGVHEEDSETDARSLADKSAALRIFEDSAGKMNLSVKDTRGSAMVVSQFTLYGETRRGNRPNFMRAARPEPAERLYNYFVGCLQKSLGKEKVATGIFREMMDVELVNDGPVTIIIDTVENDLDGK
ncbi:MAG TPA: D-aminoacyl-tRNA deacylase [Candidatus Acidoferrales bacterium]|nr:D-aminoacyl-tRNA deacylase [Candidatus Acidoferrales bacterium]